MNASYEKNRKWSDGYRSQIVSILNSHASDLLTFKEADVDVDMNCATDWVIHVEGGDIASRVRSDGRDFRDLTIRTSGLRSELTKIRNGFARWYFYGWTGLENGPIVEYIIVDLDLCRSCGILNKPWREFSNGDGTRFIAIRVSELRAAGVVKVDRVTSVDPLPQKPQKRTMWVVK